MSICRRKGRLDLEHRQWRNGVRVLRLDPEMVINYQNGLKVLLEWP